MRNKKLGVNIDHVATVRNARGEIYPSPLRAALLAEKSGADSITVHLREDRRHIRDDDLRNLKKKIIYHCIRTNKFKYIHKFNIHPKDPSNNIKEVFINLYKDNLEKFNLINDQNYYQNINTFKQIVKKRIEHIFQE